MRWQPFATFNRAMGRQQHYQTAVFFRNTSDLHWGGYGDGDAWFGAHGPRPGTSWTDTTVDTFFP